MTSNATVQSFCHNCRFEDPFYKKNSFYRTLVQLLATLVKNSLTHSLTNSCLVDFTDMTLAFEDANSKLLEVVSVADVQLLMVRNVLTTVWSRFWSWGLVGILNLNFGHDIDAETSVKTEICFWSRLWGRDLIQVLKRKFGQDFDAEFWSGF